MVRLYSQKAKLLVLLLLGMGLRRFSMSPAFIPSIKDLASHLTTNEAESILNRALKLKTTTQVKRFLADQLEKIAPGTLELQVDGNGVVGGAWHPDGTAKPATLEFSRGALTLARDPVVGQNAVTITFEAAGGDLAGGASFTLAGTLRGSVGAR